MINIKFPIHKPAEEYIMTCTHNDIKHLTPKWITREKQYKIHEYSLLNKTYYLLLKTG